jgi:hypothetical protein
MDAPLWLGSRLLGAAWALAALLPAEKGRLAWDPLVDRGRLLGRWCFGISLPVFGISHFVYHDFVATWIPRWLPAPQFWAYFTGAAHCAAAAPRDAFEWNGLFVASALCASALIVAATCPRRT